MSTPESKFSARLRAARDLRGLSQSELADRAGLKPSAVSHFETGKRAPSFDNLKKLADALEVSTDYLLGRTDDPKPTDRTAAGPTYDKLFRDAEKMSEENLQILSGFAEMLAKKRKQKDGDS